MTDYSITMEITDQAGKKIRRSIALSDVLTVADTADGEKLSSFIHLREPMKIQHSAEEKEYMQPYAPDYGNKTPILVKELTGISVIEMTICLEN